MRTKTASILAGSLMLAASCGASPGTSASPATSPADSAPVSSPPAATSAPASSAPPSQGGPEAVKPTGDAVNTRKVSWERAKPVSKGGKVQLYWWSGVAPCTVLDRVQVKETSKKVTITLYEGASPKAKDVACIMIAVEKTTTVKLKSPLGKRKLVDGGKP